MNRSHDFYCILPGKTFTLFKSFCTQPSKSFCLNHYCITHFTLECAVQKPRNRSKIKKTHLKTKTTKSIAFRFLPPIINGNKTLNFGIDKLPNGKRNATIFAKRSKRSNRNCVTLIRSVLSTIILPRRYVYINTKPVGLLCLRTKIVENSVDLTWRKSN